MEHTKVTWAEVQPMGLQERGRQTTSTVTAEPAMQLRLDELLSVQLQVGQAGGE